MPSLGLQIDGPARTKKNHGEVVRVRGRQVHLPSRAWRAWRAAALPGLRLTAQRALREPLAVPLNCAALFYRDRLTGDAVGYYQGLADLLQEAGIVADDKWIVSWDGSRLLKDADQPRVLVVLSW